jgi:DNA-binding transcriptional ArsR family regulator
MPLFGKLYMRRTCFKFSKVVKLKREILQKTHEQLQGSPRSIAEIADALGIGWKTSEESLMALKDLGLAYEFRMKKNRVFGLKRRPLGAQITILSEFKAPDDIIVLNKPKPKLEEISDLI